MRATDSKIVKALQADPSIRVVHECGGVSRKLYWAHDTNQWEVYSRDGSKITFHYTGKSLVEAIDALKVRC